MTLRELEEGDQAALDRAIAEFAAVDPAWSFAFGYAPGADYASFLARSRLVRGGVDVPSGRVQNTLLAAFEGDRIVGRGTVRHRVTPELLERGGHLGFGVVPLARRRGVATAILRGCVAHARARGIPRALVTCVETNLGSRRTIERAGGVLDDIRPHADARVCRYWI